MRGKSKYTFVTFISTESDTIRLFYLTSSLLKSKSKYPLLAIIPEDSSSFFINKVSKYANGYKIKKMNHVNKSGNNYYFKLNALLLTEYDKIIVLDPSFFITNTIDILFTYMPLITEEKTIVDNMFGRQPICLKPNNDLFTRCFNIVTQENINNTLIDSHNIMDSNTKYVIATKTKYFELISIKVSNETRHLLASWKNNIQSWGRKKTFFTYLASIVTFKKVDKEIIKIYISILNEITDPFSIKLKKKIYNLVLTILANIYWFKYKFFVKKPKILTWEETINYILNNKASISRFGDGEFSLMTGKRKDIGFQKYNQHLSKDLVETILTRNNHLLLCIPNYLLNNKRSAYLKWCKLYLFEDYHMFSHYFDRKYVYGDANLTRFYNPQLYNHTNFDYLDKIYIPMLRLIWEGRNILIVEGYSTKLGIGNDLFDNSKSIRRIICPEENAYSMIDVIYDKIIKHYQKNDLVLLALGPTATVLAAQLTVTKKYQVIDIGHADIVYIWYLNKVKEKTPILGKYVNESVNKGNQIIIDYDEKQYKQTIVCKI